MKKNTLLINIKGVEWKVKLQSNSVFVRNHGANTYGVVYPYDREMYLNKSHLSLEIIRHELWHILLHSLDMEFTDGIPADALEEICATSYANNGLALQEAEDRIINFILGDKS